MPAFLVVHTAVSPGSSPSRHLAAGQQDLAFGQRGRPVADVRDALPAVRAAAGGAQPRRGRAGRPRWPREMGRDIRRGRSGRRGRGRTRGPGEPCRPCRADGPEVRCAGSPTVTPAVLARHGLRTGIDAIACRWGRPASNAARARRGVSALSSTTPGGRPSTPTRPLCLDFEARAQHELAPAVSGYGAARGRSSPGHCRRRCRIPRRWRSSTSLHSSRCRREG